MRTLVDAMILHNEKKDVLFIAAIVVDENAETSETFIEALILQGPRMSELDVDQLSDQYAPSTVHVSQLRKTISRKLNWEGYHLIPNSKLERFADTSLDAYLAVAYHAECTQLQTSHATIGYNAGQGVSLNDFLYAEGTGYQVEFDPFEMDVVSIGKIKTEHESFVVNEPLMEDLSQIARGDRRAQEAGAPRRKAVCVHNLGIEDKISLGEQVDVISRSNDTCVVRCEAGEVTLLLDRLEFVA